MARPWSLHHVMLHFRRRLSLRRPLLLLPVRAASSSSSSSSSPDKDGGLAIAIARLVNAHPAAAAAAPWPPDLESDLSHLAPRLTPTALLSSLSLLRPPSAAVPLFNWARRHLPLSSLRPAAAKTLHLLLRSNNLRPARDFLLSPHLPSLPDHSFNALIRALANSGRLRDAIALFDQMPTLGTNPSAFSYNALLSALLRRGRTRSATRLYAAMLRSAVVPDACTFNTLIRGFCLNSMVPDAFRFFREMSRRGVVPDAVTYNTLLDGLCRAGKVNTARNLLAGMLTKSPDIAPNVVSYTTLIRGYFSQQQPAEAVAAFDEMVAAGVEPNRITYNTLVRGLCEARRMDLVRDLLERAEFRPDACTFNTLIAAHCGVGVVGDALKVFDEMLRLRVKADSATYSTLIRALCRSGDFGRAEELVDELLDKAVLARRGGCAPLIAAYNPVFEYFCHNGKAEKARRLFQELMERRAKVDVGAFKTLILGHCKEGTFAEAYKLLSSMARMDLKPDTETFEALINGCLGRGKARLAWNALKKMSACGHRPSTSNFHVVLSSLLKKDGCAEEASNLVELMLDRKIRQNIDLSTDVIVGLFTNDLNDRAFEIVGLLYDSGYHVKMEKLVEYLCQCQKFMEAMELLRFCLEKHWKLDRKLYDMVVNELCSTGRAPEAFGLFYEMTEKGCDKGSSSCLYDLKYALEAIGRSKEADFVSKQLSRASN